MLKPRRAVQLQVAAFVLVLALLIAAARFFPLLAILTNMQQKVVLWGAWGALFCPLLFALCNLLLLPGGILCVGSGFFYGLWWGFFLIFVGNAISAALSFAISRWAGQNWWRRTLSNHAMLRALEPAVEHEGWKIIVLSQLHPLFPTSLINYFYGLTRIPFGTYMFWTSIGRAPGLFLYVYLGTLGQYGLNLARGRTHPRLIEYWTWGGAFVVSALLLVLLSRVAVRAVNERTNVDRATGQAGETDGRAVRIIT